MSGDGWKLDGGTASAESVVNVGAERRIWYLFFVTELNNDGSFTFGGLWRIERGEEHTPESNCGVNPSCSSSWIIRAQGSITGRRRKRRRSARS